MSAYQTIIGIDPGKSGGMAMIRADGPVTAIPMPPDDVIISTLAEWASPRESVVTYLEQVGGFVHKTGPDGRPQYDTGASMFKFGRNCGFIEGALMALGISYRLVPPQRWQQSVPRLRGVKGKTERKRVLKAEAARRFPTCNPTLLTADALLIADYGRLIYQ